MIWIQIVLPGKHFLEVHISFIFSLVSSSGPGPVKAQWQLSGNPVVNIIWKSEYRTAAQVVHPIVPYEGGMMSGTRSARFCICENTKKPEEHSLAASPFGWMLTDQP